MSETERITIRIPSDKVEALEVLVREGKYPTISDAIRAAIDSFVDSNSGQGRRLRRDAPGPRHHRVSTHRRVTVLQPVLPSTFRVEVWLDLIGA